MNGLQQGPSRDGAVWVMQEKCATCIFRPGNLMRLKAGRVRQMKRIADMQGTGIICHDVSDTPRAAVCRGYFDNHKSLLLQIAERIGVIRFEDAP